MHWVGWMGWVEDGVRTADSGPLLGWWRMPAALSVHPTSPLPSLLPLHPTQITAEVKNVLGTVGSGVQEVIANTKGTVSSLFGKGATTGSTPSFSMT